MGVFESAIDFIITNIEGGHANDPQDRGGDTWYGIARTSHPNETPWPPTRERAIEIYRTRYWEPIKGDLLPPRLAVAVLDCAINNGTETAIRLLQRVVGATVDGKLGPKTLAKVLARAPKPLTREFLTQRVMLYSTLDQFPLYAHSWVYRCFQIASFVEALP